MENRYCVIMGGGIGSRFWPFSRNNRPKQFLDFFGIGRSLLQMSYDRFIKIIPKDHIFIVTNEIYVDLVKEQLPDIAEENILLEPCGRNTAPCIGLAAAVIRKKYQEAMMLVLPSDHLIQYVDLYIDTLKQAIAAAQQDHNLVTIGITPTYPETGYGYIQFQRDETASAMPGVYQVDRFVEKPNLETAKEYLASRRYLWNSGMFVWTTTSILMNLQQFMPDIYAGLEQIAAAVGTPDFETVLEQQYAAFRSESIDFGVMEKADCIYTIPGNFGWDDVGNWLALERINATNELGNYIEGDVITVNTQRSTICGKNKLIAAVGVEDLIVIDTEDATLICAKDSTQDVKKVIENLKICNRSSLL